MHIINEILHQPEEESQKQTPLVIVVKGSGGLADLLSYIFESDEK